MRYLIALLLLLPGALALEGHMTLLTVADDPVTGGGTADLYLEVRPGNGAIFMDSFPLTRLDTQSSTRYANQIACDFLEVDCRQYDFFYTIRSNSAIVGGPSAGAPIAVLTAAVLDREDVRQDMAMTGTINSGGIIGPVGGIPEKVQGASAAGVTVVLAPLLAGNGTARGPDANLSTPQVEVIRVGTLAEALELFTGKGYARVPPPLEEPREYEERMEAVAQEICSRTALLRAGLAERGIAYNDTYNYTARIDSLPAGHEYTRASLCFSANVEMNDLLLRNESAIERARLLSRLENESAALDIGLAQRVLSTITDLEVYAIVQERLIEARALFESVNRSDPPPAQLAYAQERLTSAQSWSRFFGMEGRTISLDEEYLRRACLSKIAEAEERINYVRLYASDLVDPADAVLKQAYATPDMVLCVFAASKAKAQANLVASALFVQEENVRALLREKLSADDFVVRQQAAKGNFPLLGYSYMRYAQDLAEVQPYSALTFAEYSLELSNLDMYFPQPRSKRLSPQVRDGIVLFALGAIFGASLALFLVRDRLAKALKGPPGGNRRTGPSREKR